MSSGGDDDDDMMRVQPTVSVGSKFYLSMNSLFPLLSIFLIILLLSFLVAPTLPLIFLYRYEIYQQREGHIIKKKERRPHIVHIQHKHKKDDKDNDLIEREHRDVATTSYWCLFFCHTHQHTYTRFIGKIKGRIVNGTYYVSYNTQHGRHIILS